MIAPAASAGVSAGTSAGAAAGIRPAASLIVLRDSPRGVQVLLMRRPERGNDFRSGACVFPGGVVDAGDAAAHRWCFGQDDAQASRRLGLGAGGLDYFVAALRECFEEVGLLFACRRDGAPLDLGAQAGLLRGWRQRLHRGEATLAQLCAALDCRLDLRETAYFAHWLTPVIRPKRFDTRFFVRLAPPAQAAEPDLGEALELMWLTPDEALDPARGLKLLNVTQRTLHELRGFAGAQAAYEAALARRGVQRILPRPVSGVEPPFVIPGQPAYDEIARLDPEGRGHLRSMLAPGDATLLAPGLLRIAGARRHAYLVSSPDSAAAAIDADPGDAAAWAALQAAAAGATVRWLLGTSGGGAAPAESAGSAESAARLARAWPQAAPGGRGPLQLGPGATLEPLHGGWLLVQARVLIGGDVPAAAAAGTAGADWLAGAHGFLRPLARS